MNDPAIPQRFATLLNALDTYRVARHAILEAMGLPVSNRDPLAEFSEHLVQALLGGGGAAPPGPPPPARPRPAAAPEPVL
jgi:hypothetical protein